MKLEPVKRILVGVDHSPASLAAFHEGQRLAEASGADLHVVNVLDQRILDDLEWDYPFENADIVAGYERRLKHLAGEETAGASHELLVGHPFIELLHAARDSQADLLILGSRGFSGIESGRVGAVASKCVRKAPLPVMLVRQSHRKPFRRIVACIDFSDTSKLAAAHALQVARQEGAVLELVHVSHAGNLIMMGLGGLEPAAPVFALDDVITSLQHDLEKFSQALLPQGKEQDVEIICTILEGPAVTATLCEHLVESEADLAVLGTRGRTFVKGLIMGTTAEGIIHDAPCSVLAIKAEDFVFDVD